ncbi:hypothetical protein ACIQRS_20345 [Streptomyces termitum]|uniref:Uncharacterized protein n=1 Tax=Streptomyces termitum TaxID=67368 RepID=A0A918T1G4_9ACTN|nr:hypothetical protein [Streptomyces termitum]GHA85256.1 hypothetical protein GCM10010305_31270 [Streptomyces termitum]
MSEQLDTPTTIPLTASDVINCRIRALWATGVLSPAGREEYGRLLVEWECAMRAEQELAA